MNFNMVVGGQPVDLTAGSNCPINHYFCEH